MRGSAGPSERRPDRRAPAQAGPFALGRGGSRILRALPAWRTTQSEGRGSSLLLGGTHKRRGKLHAHGRQPIQVDAALLGQLRQEGVSCDFLDFFCGGCGVRVNNS